MGRLSEGSPLSRRLLAERRTVGRPTGALPSRPAVPRGQVAPRSAAGGASDGEKKEPARLSLLAQRVQWPGAERRAREGRSTWTSDIVPWWSSVPACQRVPARGTQLGGSPCPPAEQESRRVSAGLKSTGLPRVLKIRPWFAARLAAGVDERARPARFWPRAEQRRKKQAIWLILPVVICLSQRLSHACPSTSRVKVKPRMAH